MSTEESIYYVRRRGRIDGPWSMNKLRSEVSLQKLGRHHEVSVDKETWMRAGDVADLFVRVEVRKVLSRSVEGPAATSPYRSESRTTTRHGEPGVWYYSIDGQQQGPVAAEELAQMIGQGQLSMDSLVWTDGMENWLPVEQVPSLVAALEAPAGASDGETFATRMVDTAPAHSAYAQWAIGTGAASLLFSWIPLVGFGGVAPIVLGILAIRQIRGSYGAQKGEGLAIVGIVLGTLAVLAAMFVLFIGVLVIWQSA